ncbi:hypothetical protein YM3MPS_03340 [Mycobacterium pseudoshottsii]|nr:hypothetical protein DL240490_02288 [Mycobacterium marinum]BEH74531.1 hypothetical protein YM3MPS_03340 [Mycobacterium pseudoshottsii]
MNSPHNGSTGTCARLLPRRRPRTHHHGQRPNRAPPPPTTPWRCGGGSLHGRAVDRIADPRAGMTGCASSTYCWPPAPASAKCSHSPGTTSTASTVTVPSPCTSVTDSTRNPTGHKAGGEPYTVTTPEFGAATLREHAPPRHAPARGQYPHPLAGDPRRGLQVGCAALDPQARRHRGRARDRAGSLGPAGRTQQQRNHPAALRRAVRAGARLHRRLDEYSRPIRALQAVEHEQAG